MIANRLLDDAVYSIRSGDMNAALALGQKMDDLLNQLKVCMQEDPALTLGPWPESTNILAADSSNHT